MNFNLFQRCSLKTRVTLFTLAIFLISLWSLTFYASLTLRHDMQRLLSDQQFSTVSLIAEEVNQEIGERFGVLDQVAGRVSSAMLDHPAALQTFLEERLISQGPFNAGVFVTGTDGVAVAGIPLSAGMIGVNYQDRDYIAGALLEGKRTIGRPVIGRVLRVPVFGMGVPIRDPQGVVIGALAGITNLSQPNFLDRITHSRYGQSGGYLLVAPLHRLVVTASDKSRIMETLPAPGVNPGIDRFLAGYEGSAVIRHSQGIEVLASDKGIPAVGWIAATHLPTAEAFAPIRAMQQRMIIATIFLTLLAGGLTWWMLRRQLFPMLTAVRTLAAWSANHQPPLPIVHRDEIGTLISSFNRLLEILGRREQALKDSEGRFRSVMENITNVAVQGYALDGTVTFWNRASELLYGYSAAEALGGNLLDLIIPPEMREAVTGAIRQMVETGETIPSGELLLKKKDGSSVPVFSNHVMLKPVGGPPELFCLDIDLTERRQMECQLQQLALYDSLTQLPNRRLFNDRLSQAIAVSKRSGCYSALMFLDLDNFKSLNDTHGHTIGDLLLIEAADRLKSCVREMDTVARFGGDEFVVNYPALKGGACGCTRTFPCRQRTLHWAFKHGFLA